MLLAPVARRPPRGDRRAARRPSSRRCWARSSSGPRSPARVSEPVPLRRLAPARARGGARGRRGVRRRRRGRGRADPGRVRIREPDRPAGRGERAPRRVRRCARADPRAPRPLGLREYYFNDAGQPDPAARRVGAGSGARRGRSGGRLSGRVRGRPRRRDPGCGVAERRRGRAARPSSCCSLRSRRRSSATASCSTCSSASARCTRARRAPSSARCRGSRRPGTCTAPRARCGCGRPRFGDDKDRVVVRSNGEPTYLAADIAYMQDKRERGFDRQLVPVGSDHHAYARAMKAAMAALGGDPDTVEVAADPVRPPRRGRRARSDVEAPRRLRDARRAARRDRRRRHPVLHAPALARPDAGSRSSSSRASSRARTPSTTSSTRTRGSRRCCGGCRRSGSPRRWVDRRRGAPVSLDVRERDLIKRLVAFPERGRRGRRAARRRTGSRGTRSSLPQDFTAFYETATSSGRRRRRSSRSGSRCRSRRSATIALSLELLGVSAPESM